MFRAVQGRPDQVGHSCVDDHDLRTGRRFFVVKRARNQFAALRDQRAAQFEMHGLAFVDFQVAVEDVEIGFEVGHRFPVGVVVVDAESAAHVEVFQNDALFAEPLLDVEYPFAERFEHLHIADLRADVEVQPDDFEVCEFFERSDRRVDFVVRDAEFVIRFAGGDVAVRFWIDVGVDPKRDSRLFAHSSGDFVDDLQFVQRFAVEREDFLAERVFDLPVGFADAGEYDLRCRKPVFDGHPHFVAADAVHAHAGAAHGFDDARVEVRFQRIMYFIAVTRRRFGRLVQCAV